jgi:two-component system, OmpR family, response regulator
MTNDKKVKLYLVDDDALFLKVLGFEFTKYPEFVIETFATGELCIKSLSLPDKSPSEKPVAIVLDYHLDGIDKNAMNGLEVLDKIKSFNPNIPVIMLSSQDKIEVAVNCMKHQAFDYIVKSETAFIRLQKAIAAILHNQKREKELSWYMERM